MNSKISRTDFLGQKMVELQSKNGVGTEWIGESAFMYDQQTMLRIWYDVADRIYCHKWYKFEPLIEVPAPSKKECGTSIFLLNDRRNAS